MKSASNENTPVLITGGAGFIGSHLADFLLEKGHPVIVLDDLSTGSLTNMEQALENPQFEFIEGSILNRDLVEELVSKSKLIFHLAAVVGVKNVVENPRKGIEVNFGGTENVLRAASKANTRIVLASSSEVYGISREIPFEEDGPRTLGPTNIQRWSYALCKALDEHLGLTYFNDGLQVSIVRYFNAYGPRISESGYGSVIARFISQAFKCKPFTLFGDGNQTRAFTFVNDTVNGTYLAGTHPNAIGEAFNIGSDRETSIRELAHEISRQAGCEAVFNYVPFEQAYGPGFQDIYRRVPSIEKAKSLLGFSPGVTLEKGLKLTIEWARENYVSANSHTE
ncbi:MAG: NAD-dependent epimerase/dehydratase family protein [bacterium]